VLISKMKQRPLGKRACLAVTSCLLDLLPSQEDVVASGCRDGYLWLAYHDKFEKEKAGSNNALARFS